MAKRSWQTRSKVEARASRKRAGIRLNLIRRTRNKPIRTAVKTYIGRAERMIKQEAAETSVAVIMAISQLDKAATKGVIHPNQAARRKSRLVKKLNAMAVAG